MAILHCGDCLTILNQMPAASIDLVVTDPPYKVITGGPTSGNRPKGILAANNQFFADYPDLATWLHAVYRVLKDGTHCYVFTNTLNLTDMLVTAQAVGFKLHNLLVWEKNNCTPSQWYMKNCEYVLFLRKGRAKYVNHVGASKTVHRFNNILGNKQHPTEKPVDLLRFYIENSSAPGDTVLDPFMGSGATLAAAIASGRKAVGVEIDPAHFSVAKARLGTLSSKETKT